MTRKRFVKLLMADGWSRNGANAVAQIARAKGVSYQTAISAASCPDQTVKEFTEVLQTIVNSLCEQISHVSEALSKAITAFCEAFIQEMQNSKGE